MIYKPCSLCGQRTPKARYRYNKNDSWKTRSWCKLCQKEKDRDKYYKQKAQNPERFKEQARKRYLNPAFKKYKNKWARKNYKRKKQYEREYSYYGNHGKWR